ncbi:ChaN family lipoprotein [Lutimaribacter sp. EGI FJ00015]|uniref:ChaN family lipoprotein n=1 Tax=Lutimaribacter degradans TaxID=2945989 RepID=A0ACC5ZZP5_9RHOB|nr:ChaN family lipoprotein [Lutimaribacter sp. EGI FJ00013]MCM2563517.1 ChaN family lipoprotein [Lutimaribacter sp. EGI FJ00013]MCO0614697.1 ChaN family lipoprotein [Lutimaribacter sp. EGI FJ00015]MCO0637367.1 ChaN family lipoprotein [Lutimaribacter sp. EGI FJ00014]
MKYLVLALSLLAPPLAAQGASDARIVILGEIHDNPSHHETQAEWTARIAPSALVFEMLTPDQAERVTPDIRGDADALGAALDWAASGWPDFTMYHPIFTAAPKARVYGAAVPREAARAAFGSGVVQSFGPDADTFGLSDPLPEARLQARLEFQAAAHCDALPDSALPKMVDLQRLRDAVLARTALQALEETGGPVVVITGNGHARADWGVPVYLSAARPDVSLFTLGQSEDGRIAGQFDKVIDAPATPRDDPCAAFAKD